MGAGAVCCFIDGSEVGLDEVVPVEGDFGGNGENISAK